MEHFFHNTDGNFVPIFGMIEELEDALNEKYNIPSAPTDRTRGVYFHLWMLGVPPAGQGKGIGRKLAQHSVAWGRKRGFKVAFAECTGPISTHILVRHTGASVAKFIDYATWNGCDTAHILRGLAKKGHKGMSLTINQFD